MSAIKKNTKKDRFYCNHCKQYISHRGIYECLWCNNYKGCKPSLFRSTAAICDGCDGRRLLFATLMCDKCSEKRYHHVEECVDCNKDLLMNPGQIDWNVPYTVVGRNQPLRTEICKFKGKNGVVCGRELTSGKRYCDFHLKTRKPAVVISKNKVQTSGTYEKNIFGINVQYGNNLKKIRQKHKEIYRENMPTYDMDKSISEGIKNVKDMDIEIDLDDLYNYNYDNF